MSSSRFIAVAALIFFSFPSSISTAQERFRVRSVFVDPAGQVSAVVELPPGSTPEPSDFQLVIDENPVATAKETRGQELSIMFFVDVSG